MHSLKPKDSRSKASGEKVKVLARKNRRAVKLNTTGTWPSVAYGVDQYGLSPTDLKQFRSTAAAVEIGMRQQHNPVIQARLCIFSWWLRFWDENQELHQLGGSETILPSDRPRAGTHTN